MNELDEYTKEFKEEFEKNFIKLKKKYGYVVIDARCCYICADDFKYYERIYLGKVGHDEHVYVFYFKGKVVAITELECIIGTLRDVEICENLKQVGVNE